MSAEKDQGPTQNDESCQRPPWCDIARCTRYAEAGRCLLDREVDARWKNPRARASVKYTLVKTAELNPDEVRRQCNDLG